MFPMTIPSESNARELGIADFLHALGRVELCQSADAAQIIVERALLTGYMTLSVGEVVRAIEMRLPAATPAQMDELSMIRSRSGDVRICRVLGAFGDRVLVLVSGTDDHGIPRTVLNLGAMQAPTVSIPTWDVTRPAERRVWYIPTDGISAQSEVA